MNGRQKAAIARHNRRPAKWYIMMELEIVEDLPDCMVTADGRRLPKPKVKLSRKAAKEAGKRRVAVLEELAVREFGVDLNDPTLEKVID